MIEHFFGCAACIVFGFVGGILADWWLERRDRNEETFE